MFTSLVVLFKPFSSITNLFLESFHHTRLPTSVGSLRRQVGVAQALREYVAFFPHNNVNHYGTIFYRKNYLLIKFNIETLLLQEFCHNLEVLDVSNVASLGARSTSISIDKLQRSCPNLRILRAANVNFTPTVCSAACPPVPGFPKLEELSIPFHENFIVPSLMQDGNTDWTLELLTKDAAKLTLLDIRGSRYISPRGLLKVPTWTLKHLSISNCTKLEEQHETLGNVFTKVTDIISVLPVYLRPYLTLPYISVEQNTGGR